MFNLIVIEGRLFGQNGFQQFLELRDIPLLIAQIVDKLSHGLFGVYLKDLIERAAGGNHPQVLVQRDQGFTHRVDDAVRVFAGRVFGYLGRRQFFTGGFQPVFYLPALGYILDGKQDDTLFSRRPLDLPGVQKHDTPADVSKIVFNLVVIEGRLLREDGFQQFPQLRNIPLFIAQVVDKLSHGFFRVYLEDFIEGAAGGDHP